MANCNRSSQLTPSPSPLDPQVFYGLELVGKNRDVFATEPPVAPSDLAVGKATHLGSDIWHFIRRHKVPKAQLQDLRFRVAEHFLSCGVPIQVAALRICAKDSVRRILDQHAGVNFAVMALVELL